MQQLCGTPDENEKKECGKKKGVLRSLTEIDRLRGGHLIRHQRHVGNG
jgi:hypothetical protein